MAKSVRLSVTVFTYHRTTAVRKFWLRLRKMPSNTHDGRSVP